MEITRYVLPVVVGAMSGMILIILGENYLHQLFPLLPGTDPYDPESLAKAMQMMPARFFELLLINYTIASFFAGFVATLVARRNTIRPAVVVGIVLTLAGLYNALNLHQPTWFSVTNLLIYLPMTCVGYLVIRKKSELPAAGVSQGSNIL